MQIFITALQFLTIIFLKKNNFDSSNLSKSVGYFPFVGLILGVFLVLTNFLFFYIFPEILVNLIVILTLIILTGALHLDGLADSCDGFFSGKEKEEILNIMHDSHLGTMGITSIIILLLLKLISLNCLPSEAKNKILLLFPVIGRWNIALLGFISPYAYKFNGKGKACTKENIPYKEFLKALIFTFLMSFILFRVVGLFILIINILIVFLIRNFCLRKIKGITGDILGASCEIGEAITLVFFCMKSQF